MKHMFSSDHSASVVIIILLVSVFMFYLISYFKQIRTFDSERRYALLIAADWMQSSSESVWEYDDGFYSDSVLFNNSYYYISKTLTTLSDNARIVSVSVMTPGEERVELVRNVTNLLREETD